MRNQQITPAIQKIGIAFLVIQGAAIITCFIFIILAVVKSGKVGGDDDTLGAFVTGFLVIAIYLTAFWIINLNMVRAYESKGKSGLLKLGFIFLFSVVPILAGLFFLF